MKLEKSKVQEGRVGFVSVCPTLDVAAVASGRDVTVYRMQLSRVASVTCEGDVTTLCWGPSGKVLAVGTACGLVLVNIEEGVAIGVLCAGRSVVHAEWTAGERSGGNNNSNNGTNSSSDTQQQQRGKPHGQHPLRQWRPFSALESSFQPSVTPFGLATADPACEAIRLKHQLIEDALTAHGEGRCHFITAVTTAAGGGDHTLHIAPYGVKEALAAPLPGSVLSLSSFRLLRSVVCVADVAGGDATAASRRVIRSVGVRRRLPLEAIACVCVRQAVLERTLELLAATVAQVRAGADEAAGAVATVLAELPDAFDLFVSGPRTPAQTAFFGTHGAAALGKVAARFHARLSDLARILALGVAGTVEYVGGVARFLRADAASAGLPEDGQDALEEAADLLRRQCAALLAEASSSQVATAQVFAWLTEVARFVGGRRRSGSNGGGGGGGGGGGLSSYVADDTAYDQKYVLELLQANGPVASSVGGFSASLAVFASAVDAAAAAAAVRAAALAAAASEGLVASTEEVAGLPAPSSSPDADTSSSLPASQLLLASAATKRHCTRFFASAAVRSGSVDLTVVTHCGPEARQEWVTRGVRVAAVGCLAVCLYVNTQETEVRLLVLSVNAENEVWITSYTLLQEGQLAVPMAPTTAAAPVDAEIVEVAAASASRLFVPQHVEVSCGRVSCSPKGLACVAVTTGDGSTLVAEYLVEDEDEEEEEEEEEQGEA
eukprot:Rhum_TRINITY_DN13187_c0_g2::Rhum_TRINITY_DN13187_c0_g2_i1::g.57655::m.57655